VIDSSETYGLGPRGVYIPGNTIIVAIGICIVSILGAKHERGAGAREFWCVALIYCWVECWIRVYVVRLTVIPYAVLDTGIVTACVRGRPGCWTR
jgi:hypothetical protein